MSDFEDKLNTLLNDPGTMAQVMQIAQSLSGADNASAAPPAQPSPPPVQNSFSSSPSPSPPVPPQTDGIDPQMLKRFLPLMEEIQSAGTSDAANLLLALRPYLKAEKQEKVGRAIQIARLIRVGKKFFSGLEG